MTGNIIVEHISSLEALKRYADAWDKLAVIDSEQLPFNSFSWISSFLEYRLNADEQWVCLLAFEENELIGVLPLIITSGKVMGVNRKFFHSPNDGHTRSVSLVVFPGKELSVIEAFLSNLIRVEPNWYSLYFERIQASSHLMEEINQCSGKNQVFFDFVNVGSYLPTDGSFDDFRKSLKKSFRSNLNTANSRLSRSQNVYYEFLRSDEATEDQLERFMKVEVAGWKGRVGSAIIKSQELIDFYMTLTKRLSQKGWLEWHFLMAEGKTIAGNLAVRCGRKLFILKLGYDEEFSKCSPGTLLFEQVVKYAIESDNISQIDLITDPPWAKNWQTRKMDCFNLWIYPPGFIPLMVDILPRRLRKALRQVPFLRDAVQRIRSLIHGNTS